MKNTRTKYTSATTVEGHLERITYFNEDTHYTIARLKPAGLTAVVTVVGYLAGVSLGETIKVNGRWETHPKYGQQLKIDSFEVTLPAGIEGIRTYLGSGIVKGIGPSLAKRMVKVFGAETLEIIEGHPQRLVEVDGIGETKAAQIQSAWSEHHALRGLMQFLQKMGIQTSYCAKIYKAYGSDAVTLIQEDPFVLADDFPALRALPPLPPQSVAARPRPGSRTLREHPPSTRAPLQVRPAPHTLAAPLGRSTICRVGGSPRRTAASVPQPG